MTCIKYIPQLGCICAGYNLGVWSLLSLVSLSPHYTSSIPGGEPGPAPVQGVAWQEPLDDPRHYSYIWILRGAGKTGLSYANMYSLSYRERRPVSDEAPCYEDLESVALRFEHLLTAENDTDTMVSRVIGELKFSDKHLQVKHIHDFVDPPLSMNS